jgi:DNA polymerase
MEKIKSYLKETLEVLPSRMAFASTTWNAKASAISDLKNEHHLTELKKNIAKCQLCFLGARRKSFIPFGGKRESVMVLVEQPGFADEEAGRYFSGDEGPMMEKMLGALGTSLEKVYVSAAVKCASAQTLGGNLNAVSICLRHLENELQLVKPKLILAFGKWTYELLTDKRDFEVEMGKESFYQNQKIIFTHGLQELLTSPDKKKETWSHLKSYQPLIKTFA